MSIRSSLARRGSPSGVSIPRIGLSVGGLLCASLMVGACGGDLEEAVGTGHLQQTARRPQTSPPRTPVGHWPISVCCTQDACTAASQPAHCAGSFFRCDEVRCVELDAQGHQTGAAISHEQALHDGLDAIHHGGGNGGAGSSNITAGGHPSHATPTGPPGGGGGAGNGPQAYQSPDCVGIKQDTDPECSNSGGGGHDPNGGSGGGNGGHYGDWDCTKCSLKYISCQANCAFLGPILGLPCMGVCVKRFQDCARAKCDD